MKEVGRFEIGQKSRVQAQYVDRLLATTVRIQEGARILARSKSIVFEAAVGHYAVVEMTVKGLGFPKGAPLATVYEHDAPAGCLLFDAELVLASVDACEISGLSEIRYLAMHPLNGTHLPKSVFTFGTMSTGARILATREYLKGRELVPDEKLWYVKQL